MPVQVGAEGGFNMSFMRPIEAGMSVSRSLVCVKVGPRDEATAARLAQQKVCLISHFFLVSLHTMAYTSSFDSCR